MGERSPAPSGADAGLSPEVDDAGDASLAFDAGLDGGSRDAGVITWHPVDAGWARLPNTRFTDVCQSAEAFFDFPADCRAVIFAWGGGVADSKRNRLIVWGGGHNDYYGNEVYALDLVDRQFKRLNDPTRLATKTACISALPDGKPTSRHTYGGLAYAPLQDRMILYGGVASCEPGGFLSDVWTLDFETLAASPGSGQYWARHVAELPNINYGGVLGVSDYDPVTQHSFVATAGGQLYEFDPATNGVVLRASVSYSGYHYTGVIEPQRRQLFMIGGQYAGTWNLDTATFTNLTQGLSGCEALQNIDYPGLTFDSDAHRIVGWAGGAALYVVDLDARRCSLVNVGGTAPGPQIQNGTNGRFRYFSSIRSFVLVNDPDDDAYVAHVMW